MDNKNSVLCVVQVSKEKLIKVLKLVAYNNLFMNLVYAPVMYWSQKSAGISFLPEECPTIKTMIRDMAVSTIIQEIVFYYSHRYKYIELYGPRSYSFSNSFHAAIHLAIV